MASERNRLRLTREKRQGLYGIAYIAPGFLIMLAFSIIPIFMTFYYSLTNYNLVREPVFNNFDNYIKLFTNTQLRKALYNTLIYVLITVPLQTLVALFAASFLAEYLQNRFGRFLRGVIFIPILVSYISAAAVWKIIFNSRDGIINQILSLFGIGNINWLGSQNTALLCVALVAVWKSAGYFMVIFYAGIMNISVDVKEAAIIDGASTWQTFWHITVPILKPITYMVVTLGIIWSFQAFDLVYQITGGGPGYATTTIAYVIYAYAFQDWRIGYACAIAIVLLVIIVLLHLIEQKFMKEE